PRCSPTHSMFYSFSTDTAPPQFSTLSLHDALPISAAGDLRTPFGVAVNGGRVYVADFGNDRVEVFGQDGSLLSTLGGRGSGDGQFQRPAGVAVGPDGTLYVTDHFNDRVQRFSGEGRFQAQLGVPLLAAATAATTPTPVATAVPT